MEAFAEKFDEYSELAITGKSSLGNVAREKFDRPASTVKRPLLVSPVRVTRAPSGNFRTISCKVMAETVVEPGCSI